MRSVFPFLAGVVSVVAAAGCHHAVAPAPTAHSSVRFVEPPVAPLPPTPPADVKIVPATMSTVPAEPIPPLALPVYPASIPRKERPAVALVGVHITIDTSGRVANVSSSLYAFSTPDPHAAEFRAAAEAALAQWRFTPAELRRYKPVDGPRGQQGYVRVIGQEPIEWGFDVAFTFNAAGDVTTALPK